MPSAKTVEPVDPDLQTNDTVVSVLLVSLVKNVNMVRKVLSQLLNIKIYPYLSRLMNLN